MEVLAGEIIDESSSDCVKVICNNPDCNEGLFMHRVRNVLVEVIGTTVIL